jgi:hypothetical protein
MEIESEKEVTIMSTFAAPSHGHILTPFAAPKKWEVWIGRVLSALPVLMMGFSAAIKLMHAPPMTATWENKFGWPQHLMIPVALIEIVCALLFAVPRTAVLGAILVAGFFGAAFATHLRVGDGASGVIPIALAVFAWAGLYLRDERLRSLLPLRGLWRQATSLAT